MKKKIRQSKFIYFSINSIVYKFAPILTINCNKNYIRIFAVLTRIECVRQKSFGNIFYKLHFY